MAKPRLVVAVDGDRFGLRERMRQLGQKLADEELPQRGDDEMIVINVPTRSTETWELWLCGERDIDEDDDYKQEWRAAERHKKRLIRTAIEEWFSELSAEELEVEERTMPSLAAGRVELERRAHSRR